MKRFVGITRQALAVLLLICTPALTHAAVSTFTVRWTAPGDDGLVGRASRYDLRYSTAPITEANFMQATALTGLPLPAAVGTQQSYVVSGLNAGITYYLAIETMDEVGNRSPLSNVLKKIGQTTGNELPGLTLSFSGPYPNPARNTTSCAFTLPEAAPVRVQVFDLSGRLLRTLADGPREAGTDELRWDLSDASGQRVNAGIYLLRAQLGTQTWTRRISVVR